MTTYQAIPNSDIDPESPITTTLMTLLRDNPIAIQEGDASAPKLQTSAYDTGSVDQAAIGASAVGQGELKTAAASGSIVVSNGSSGSYSLIGGTYSWWTGSSAVVAAAAVTIGFSWGNVDTAAGVIGVYNPASSGSASFYVDERYVQASPPYILDDIVPAFIYILIDNNTGNILGTRASLDPPWAYHGYTDITAKWVDKQGRSWRKEKQWKVEFLKEVGINPYALIQEGDYEEATQVLRNNKLVDFEITNDIKNRDMDYYPHPFVGSGLLDKSVVMLDPTNIMCRDLGELISDGFLEIPKMIEKGYIKFRKTPLPRKKIRGVKVVKPYWRNTDGK